MCCGSEPREARRQRLPAGSASTRSKGSRSAPMGGASRWSGSISITWHPTAPQARWTRQSQPRARTSAPSRAVAPDVGRFCGVSVAVRAHIVRTRRGFPREIAVSHDARQAICRVSRAARLGKSKNWLVGPFVDPTHWLRTTGRGECLPNGNRRPFRPIGTGLTLQGLGDRNGPVFQDVGEYWFDLYSTKAGSHETN